MSGGGDLHNGVFVFKSYLYKGGRCDDVNKVMGSTKYGCRSDLIPERETDGFGRICSSSMEGLVDELMRVCPTREVCVCSDKSYENVYSFNGEDGRYTIREVGVGNDDLDKAETRFICNGIEDVWIDFRE